METTVIQTFPYDALSPHTREDHPGGFDQRTGQPIPGFRGEDQLLVYDESYGQKSTGTNYWGVELLVDRDGTILRAAGGDSPIPEGGLVRKAAGHRLHSRAGPSGGHPGKVHGPCRLWRR